MSVKLGKTPWELTHPRDGGEEYDFNLAVMRLAEHEIAKEILRAGYESAEQLMVAILWRV